MPEIDEGFFIQEVPVLLKHLRADTKPAWGMLTPQAMVEHLVGSWRISNGNARVGLAIPEDQLEEKRAFLFSDTPYPKNLKNPIMPANESPPHRKPDLRSAIDQLISEIQDFFAYYEQNPDAQHIHPVFGTLDKDGWLQFQDKHMKHHFKQFGLLK